jgi:Mrp family chromosome partitioning ATPase
MATQTAFTAAMSGPYKVLLVDANLADPRAHTIFRPPDLR